MPDAVNDIVRSAVQDGLHSIERDAKVFVPVDEGDLRDSIGIKMSRDGLTGIVGPGVKAAELVRSRSGSQFGQTYRRGKRKGEKFKLSKRNKKEYFQFLKGYWAEFGTKGSSKANIPAQPARPFMSTAFKSNERRIVANVKRAVNRALARAASG